MKFPPEPTTPYVLTRDIYKRIFDKLATLNGKELSAQDEELARLFYSQLEENWEVPLEASVDKLVSKYT